MEIGSGDVERIVSGMFRRCEAVKAAGGIAAVDVVNGTVKLPQGYWYDYYTEYWLPPKVKLLPL